MDNRVFYGDAHASPPTPPSPGSTGYVNNGDPPGGIAATKIGAWWLHATPEEVRNVIVDAGLTPTVNDLTQLKQAVRLIGQEWPLAALPYPTIATSDNRITITPASATNGGTVSIPANVALLLGEELQSGVTGRARKYLTAAYTSADLDVSSTYYLRAKITAGALQIYEQKGADSDTIPGSLVGTPGGASGGGFDSTVLDMVLGKIVTGSAGSTPTVTELANAAILTVQSLASESLTRTSSGGGYLCGQRSTPLTIDWGRTPRTYIARCAIERSGNWNSPEHPRVVYNGSYSDGTGTLNAVTDRYQINPVARTDVNVASTGYTFTFESDIMGFA